jgi:ABC-type multidrug transport system fused ATPase/permease subunit
LKDVSVTIRRGQVVALVGETGSGKSGQGDNVRIGRLDRPDPDGSVVAAAAADSCTDAVVAELPKGWDSVLSRAFQNGCDLSGGQWQRWNDPGRSGPWRQGMCSVPAEFRT